MLKVNNRNTRARCEICSKLTIKIPERTTPLAHLSLSVSIVNFKHVITDWDPYVLLSEYKASQPAFTCSKLTIETLEQGVKYVQS